jgi:phage protein D
MPLERTAPQLYLRAAPDGPAGDPVRLDLVSRVIGLKYDDNESKADKLTLTLDNGDLRLFDDPAFRKGMILEVAWGYPHNMTPVRQVVVTGAKGGRELTVEARALSVLLNMVSKTRTFTGVKHSDVVRQIATAGGYGPEVQHIEDTVVVHKAVHQSKCTDAQLVRRLADQEGFEFYVDHDGFHFHSRQVGQQPVRVFTYFTPPVVGEVLDFSLENDVLALPGRTILKGRDPLERKDYEAKADAKTDSDRETLSSLLEVVDPESGRSRLDARMGSEETLPTSSSSPTSADREAKGRFRRAQQAAVKLKLEVVGDPGLMAKTVVEVRGLGVRLSGRYYVRKVTHELQAGYKCTMELVSDGHGGHSTDSQVAKGLELLEKSPQAGGKQNTKAPKPGAEQVGATEGAELEAVEKVDEETGQTRIEYRDSHGRAAPFGMSVPK